MIVPAADRDADQILTIAVLPGDGIGIEVMDAALVVLRQLQHRYLDCKSICGIVQRGRLSISGAEQLCRMKRCRSVAMRMPFCWGRWACPMFASRTVAK